MDSMQALIQAVPILALYLVTLFVLAYPLGRYLYRLMQPKFSIPVLQRIDTRVLPCYLRISLRPLQKGGVRRKRRV